MDLRQIDVLVHQHVMEVDLTGFDWPTGFRDRMVRETRDGDGIRVEWIDIPRYSSDIAAAWQVAEKLRDGGYVVTFAIYPEGMDMKNGAVVGNYRNSLTWQKWDGYADTMPLAICLAALRAVGVEVPQDA